MKRKLAAVLLCTAFVLNASACDAKIKKETPVSADEAKKEVVRITKFPLAVDYQRGSLNSLEKLNENVGKYNLDLRSYNIEALDLSGYENKLNNAMFDSKTKWPAKLPSNFNPQKMLEFHKNPGLGLRKLHVKGITGKGISIAFIDYSLLVTHEQYYDRVKMYEEVHYAPKEAQLHAPAVASIAAGKDTGAAPEADLYFIGCENYNIVNKSVEIDFSWFANAIERIIEINKTLPKEDKIRVLSISAGCQPETKGYKEFIEAAKKAVKENIFVATINMIEIYNEKFYFHGLDMDTFSDKDNVSVYKPTEWKKWLSKVEHIDNLDKYYEKKFNEDKPKELLLIPIDAKTLASPTGDKDYAFYREGGWSWTMPYIAGVYALACQVKPDITPEEFWENALATGDRSPIEKENERYIGKIINPEKLISSLKK